MKFQASLLDSIIRHGNGPYRVALLHGGPGAAGEMRPVARELSRNSGILELLQTADSVNGQIEELHAQLNASCKLPAILIGHSWGAWLGYLLAGRYPSMIRKLILVSSGAFEVRRNHNLMDTRLKRLDHHEREEAEQLIPVIHSGIADNALLKRFGELMTIADSYDTIHNEPEEINYDMHIYRRVWAEASILRETGALIGFANDIACPVVAIHGDDDPHPAEDVEQLLSQYLRDFRMIRISQCGHTPWRERHAKDAFFDILRSEIGLITEPE